MATPTKENDSLCLAGHESLCNDASQLFYVMHYISDSLPQNVVAVRLDVKHESAIDPTILQIAVLSSQTSPSSELSSKEFCKDIRTSFEDFKEDFSRSGWTTETLADHGEDVQITISHPEAESTRWLLQLPAIFGDDRKLKDRVGEGARIIFWFRVQSFEMATRLKSVQSSFGYQLRSSLQHILAAHPIAARARIEQVMRRCDYINQSDAEIADLDDIEQSISAIETALTSTSQQHVQWSNMIVALSSQLILRFEKTDSIDDLDKAVNSISKAIESCRALNRLRLLIVLGTHLQMRYKRRRDMKDLDWSFRSLTTAMRDSHIQPLDTIQCLKSLAEIYARIFEIEQDNEPVEFTAELTRIVDPLGLAIASIFHILEMIPKDAGDRGSRLVQLGFLFLQKFHATRDEDNLDSAISIFQEAKAIASPDSGIISEIKRGLAEALVLRCEIFGDHHDQLEQAICYIYEAIDEASFDHSRFGHMIKVQAKLLERRYHLTHDDSHLQDSIAGYERALDTISSTDKNTRDLVISLCKLLHHRYWANGDLQDLTRVIELTTDAIVPTTNDTQPLNSLLVSMLANSYWGKYQKLGSTADLESAITAIEAHQEVFSTSGRPSELTRCLDHWKKILNTRYTSSDCFLAEFKAKNTNPEDEKIHDAPSALHIANFLRKLYKQTNEQKNLWRAILLCKRVIPLASDDTLHLSKLQDLLSLLLEDMYVITGAVPNLDESIENVRLAAETECSSILDQAYFQGHLGRLLNVRSQLLRDPSAMQEAIDATETAVALSTGSSQHSEWLRQSAIVRVNRYVVEGSPEDLDVAFSSFHQTIGISLRDEACKALSPILWHRYRDRGDPKDLEDAISIERGILSAMPPGDHKDRASHMILLSRCLLEQHEREGSPQVLEESISLAEAALATDTSEAAHQIVYRSHLASLLGKWFEQEGTIEDLDRGIRLVKEALTVITPDHFSTSNCLNILSTQLILRYRRLGYAEDLDSAVSASEQAVVLAPNNHNDRADRYHNLGIALATRPYSEELDAAVSWVQKAVELTPDAHCAKSGYLRSAGCLLHQRFGQTGAKEDAEAARTCFQTAISLPQANKLQHAFCLMHLAELNLSHHPAIGKHLYLEEGLEYLRKFIHSPVVPPRLRISKFRRVIGLLRDMDRYEDARRLADEALDSLQSICNRFMSRMDQQNIIAEASGLAADACALTLTLKDDASKGLEQIELGRGLIIGMLVDNMVDLSMLEQQDAHLAGRYKDLREKVLSNRRARTSNSCLQTHSERYEAQKQLKDCEEAIRKIPGFEKFLLPPTVPDMMAAASKGPIVIVNVTDFGAAAIVITHTLVKAVQLPQMISRAPPTFQKALSQSTMSRQTIEDLGGGPSRDIKPEPEFSQDRNLSQWLWTTCVQPILAELDMLEMPSDSRKIPRIWWLGTGLASSLPFHAASDGDSTALNYMIPSYSPTIKALQHARDLSKQRKTLPPKSNSVLIITMPTTPGEAALTGVTEEKNGIKEVMGDEAGIRVLTYPSATQVLQIMHTAEIIHFACHGSSHPLDPSESHLLLKTPDGTVDKLTVSAIMSQSLGNRPYMAYLSACSTAETKAKAFMDEGIDLASAFQIAGFAHVIGSRWPTDDKTCVRMARYFYKALHEIDHEDEDRAVALALRVAVMELRAEDPNNIRLWAPYVHLGA